MKIESLYLFGWIISLVLGIIFAFLEIEFPNSTFLFGIALGLGIAWGVIPIQTGWMKINGK